MDKLRIPPHSDEAERGVLGSILLEPTCIEKCIERIQAQSFYDRRHQMLFEKLTEMYMTDVGMDALTIADYMKKRGFLEKVGGYDYLVDLMDTTLVAAHVEFYCDIVETKKKYRLIIEHSDDAIKRAYSCDDPPEDIIATLDDLMLNMQDGGEERTTSELVSDALELDKKIAAGGRLGLPFPWVDFQRRTFGIPPRSVTPLAGRDGKGKSRLSTFLAEFWVKQGIPILYFPFEDGAERFISNLASTNGGYDMFTIRREFVPRDFMDRHENTMHKVKGFPVYVEDMPVSAERIAGMIAKYKRKYGIEGVVIDGLKDVVFTDGDGEVGKENHVNAILNRAAKKYDVSVITVSHLTDLEDDKWISKRNIRGSKRQSQNSRMTLMFQDWLPEKMKSDRGLFDGEIALECQKASYGDTGIVILKPDLEHGGFIEVKDSKYKTS